MTDKELKDNIFADAEVIDSYSSEDGVNDGILVKLTDHYPLLKDSLFSHVTTNLLNQGYIIRSIIDDTEIHSLNAPNMIDLLVNAQNIIIESTGGELPDDSFYSGEIEFPDGSSRLIFIEMNEYGKYTIMLPSDR